MKGSNERNYSIITGRIILNDFPSESDFVGFKNSLRRNFYRTVFFSALYTCNILVS